MGADPELDKRMRLAYWQLRETVLASAWERWKRAFDEVERELRASKDDNKGDTSA